MKVKSAGFEEISHTADLEIKVWAEDLASLFVAAAEGMFHLSGIEDYEDGFSSVKESISLDAMDIEGLLILFLEELLYRLTEDYMLFSVDKISISTEFSLKAKLRGPRSGPISVISRRSHIIASTSRKQIKGYEVNIVSDI